MNEHIYTEWTSDNPQSFGGIYRSYEKYRDLNKKQIEDSFQRNDIYTRFRQFKKAKIHNPVIVYKKRDQFQADVCYFNRKEFIQSSNGYKYLLIFIDVWSKYTWVYPIKTITGREVASCMEELFKVECPKNLCTDAGAEFLNKYVKQIVTKFKVKHYIARNRTKAQTAERFILTLQRLIYQMCRFYNTNDWVWVLPTALKIYLNRKHRSIKMSPFQAEMAKHQKLLESIHKDRIRKVSKKKPKFKKGDTVRISLLRTKFTRGYHQYFTTEIWKIKKVFSNLQIPRYKVQDEHNNELMQILNENEIIKYTPRTNIFQIEQVLKTRRRNNKKQYFVKWLHHPEHFNSWISEDQFVPILHSVK